MSHVAPTETPNVVVSNPTVRKVVGNILGVASLLLSIATLVDGAIEQVEYGYITGPAAVIIAGLFGIFQLGVTSPNVPTADRAPKQGFTDPGTGFRDNTRGL
jgi:hypothetical protein